MVEKFLGMMIGWWAAKLLGMFEGSTSSSVPAGFIPNPAASDKPTTVKQGQQPATIPVKAIPAVSPGAVPAPEQPPAGLPSFPSGWTFAKTTPAVVQRAWALLPLLAMRQVKYETAPGDPNKWLAYRKEPHAQGKTGVTVYTPKLVPAVVPPPNKPGYSPVPGVPETQPIPNAAPGAPAPVYASLPAPGQRPGQGVARVLRRGMQGPDVAEWQNRLNVLGIKPQLTPDGDFGKNTDAATKAFQKSKGLTMDGEVGPNTRAAAGFGRVTT